MRVLLTLCLFGFLQSCAAPVLLERAMASNAPAIAAVTRNLGQHEVQIKFTEVVRSDDGRVMLTDQEFQVDDTTYFYPASTVKFPIALLALEKLAEDSRLSRQTPFLVQGDGESSSFEKEIIELFLVSDNDAYNRLFEYLGKDEINRRLAEKGILARISHRLSTPNSDRLTYRPLRFETAQGEVIVQTPPSKKIVVQDLTGISKGVAYQSDNRLINSPFDFSEKNYLPIRSLHGIMQRFIFPELFAENQRFRLSEADRQFVLETMKTLPFEAGYDREEYYDSYVKFFLFGDSREPLPSHIEIYNKVGFAYGTLTDCAYVKNTLTNQEYIITATVLVNANQTFNDDNYEYDEIGLPFLAELGRQLLNFNN
jgi:hypothetical protein